LPPEAWKWTVEEPRLAGQSIQQIAVGTDGFGAISRLSQPWVSSDGIAWTRVRAEGEVTFTELVAFEADVFVAVGLEPESAAFLRFTAAGSELARDDRPASAAGDVVKMGDGLLALGGSVSLDSPGGYVWRSVDGRGWARSDGPPDVVLGPSAVAEGPLVSVANASLAELSDAHADPWQSDDGTSWRAGSSIADATIDGIAAGPSGFSAVGRVASGFHDLRASAWTSADGASWSVTEQDDRSSLLSGLVRWRGTFVAFGYTLEQPRTGLIWTSRDGTAWTPLDGLDLGGLTLSDGDAADRALAITGERQGKPVLLIATAPN
jgi:hypothetical protein